MKGRFFARKEKLVEFSPNVFTYFSKFSDKNDIIFKRIVIFEPALLPQHQEGAGNREKL